jgi:RNA polymerase sigma-70 factor (ECF subfamily)
MSIYEDIIRGVRKHDRQSQMEFYDLLISPVFQSAYAVVGNESEAEEIAQDTMLKVFERTDLLADERLVMERIMRRIANNAAIDLIRKRRDVFISLEELPDDCEDEDKTDEDSDFSIDDIKAGIDAMAETYRSILALRLFDELAFDEIADMLKLNRSTARVMYVRGINKLKRLLTERKKYAN